MMKRVATFLGILVLLASSQAQTPTPGTNLPPTRPNLDYVKYSRQTVGDNNGICGGACGTALTTTAWPDGVLVLENITGNTANRQTTLPHAASFAPGTPIQYRDSSTTLAFGRGFVPQGSETLDGQTAGAIGTPTPYFVKGGLDASGNATATAVTFWTDGANWRTVLPGNVKGFRDPVTGFVATVDTSSLAGNASMVVSGPSVAVRTDTLGGPLGSAIGNYDANGNALYTQVVPDPTSVPDGYQMIAVGGAWNAVPSGGTSGSPWVQCGVDPSCTIVGSVVTWTPIIGQPLQNAVLMLTGDKTLTIDPTTVESGMAFNLAIIQDGTGNRHLTFTTPSLFRTPSGGAGVLQQTLTPNAVDWQVFNYIGQSSLGLNFFGRISAMNLTAGAVAACNTAGSTGATTGTTGSAIGNSTGTKYKASEFIATETSICEIDAVLLKIVGTSGPNYPLHAAIYTDGARTGGVVTDGVVTISSNTVTSTTAAWVAADVGQHITGTGIPADTYIGTVVNATTITLSSTKATNTSRNATASNTFVTLTTYGAPNTIVGAGSTNNPGAASLPTTGTAATAFTGITATGMTTTGAAATYYVVIWGDNVAASSTDYVSWLSVANSAWVGQGISRSANATVWTRDGADKSQMRWSAFH